MPQGSLPRRHGGGGARQEHLLDGCRCGGGLARGGVEAPAGPKRHGWPVRAARRPWRAWLPIAWGLVGDAGGAGGVGGGVLMAFGVAGGVVEQVLKQTGCVQYRVQLLQDVTVGQHPEHHTHALALASPA